MTEYERKESRYERDRDKPRKKRVKRFNKNGIQIEGERKPKLKFFPGE